MGLLFGKRNAAASSAAPSRNISERVISDREFSQSGTFKGYKRYRLTTYQVPGIADGIEHFRVSGQRRPFDIKRGSQIRLICKEVSGLRANPFGVLEVYVDNNKVGVLYDSNAQYGDLFAEPFDKVYILIEETTGCGSAFDGIEVYLFVHRS